MFKKLRVVTAVALAAFGLTIGLGSLTAADEKTPSISEIMKKSFGGKMSLKVKITAGVKGEAWDDVKKLAAEFKTHGEDLAKNKCPKGDAESWKKLTAKFKDATAGVAEAADKKDAKALAASFGKVNCKECHDAHK